LQNPPGMEPLLNLDKDRLRSRLVSQDLKRWWVAEFAGIHKTTLRRWLSGDIRRVRADHLTRVAKLLEISPEALVQNSPPEQVNGTYPRT
jgi:hypothetical protein